MRKVIGLVLLCVSSTLCSAQQFEFPEVVAGDQAALSKAMTGLANQVMAVYKESDREKYLDQLFRMQIVASQYEGARNTIASLREVLSASQPPRRAWVNVQHEIFVRAKENQTSAKVAFKDAYAQAFRDAFAQMDNRTSALVIRELVYVDPAETQGNLRSDLEKQKGERTINLADALKLIGDYEVEEAYDGFALLGSALVSEDDRRRYSMEKDVAVKMPDGATVCALIMRPLAAVLARIPTLLKFTIYVDANDNSNDARQTASNGYAGVVGFTRGKACSPDKPIPYEHDGRDAAALIDWIAGQAWSDGRVGMYGGSYEGFTQWATAKHMPKGLRALMTGAPAAPGIDVPMEGNVFWNFVYQWPFYTTDLKGADNATYNDHARWRRLNHDWYVSGRAYRDLDKIDGTPNPIFNQWIAHPGYDAYWQGLIPYEKEFTRINIPILETAGYYYGGPGAAVYYFSQHAKYNPQAEHYLLIGPYHDIGAQYGVIGLAGSVYDSLGGLQLDAVAKIDLVELRYEWFDYVFKGGPKPALLKDKVNYQVTGANVWKHAPTLAAMANDKLRFYLSTYRTGNSYRLSDLEPVGERAVDLSVDFTDRTDVDRVVPGGGVVASELDTWNGVVYVSDPLVKATEVSGLFQGHLDFVSNKKDFDFQIDLYEQTAKGEYVRLSQYWTRASYAENRSERKLLKAGRGHQLDFASARLMSRQLEPGSRLVMVLTFIKEPGRQINYGTGKDVSDESMQDSAEPLDVKWYSDSYIDVPVAK